MPDEQTLIRRLSQKYGLSPLELKRRIYENTMANMSQMVTPQMTNPQMTTASPMMNPMMGSSMQDLLYMMVLKSMIQADQNQNQPSQELLEMREMVKSLTLSREEKWKKEIEQRIARNEYLAQRPPEQPQPRTLRDDIKNFVDTRGQIETLIPKQTPEGLTAEGANAQIQLNTANKSLEIISQGVSDGMKKADRILEIAEADYKTRSHQQRMETDPQYRKQMERNYKTLGNQVLKDMEKEEDYAEDEEDEDVAFSDSDEMED